MPKYRLLAGCHTEGKDELNQPILFQQGEVFESKLDLLIHNKPQSLKFELVSNDTPVTNPTGKKPFEATVAVADSEDDELEKKTVIELKQLASEEEIELDSTMSKSDIVNCIRLARDVS